MIFVVSSQVAASLLASSPSPSHHTLSLPCSRRLDQAAMLPEMVRVLSLLVASGAPQRPPPRGPAIDALSSAHALSAP